MHYVRIYADDAGESHFEDVEVTCYPVDLIPPAPPLHMAGFELAKQVSFIEGKPGWYGELHRAPAPSLYFLLDGEWEFETSDGEKRTFRAGTILRTDDTVGKGHISRVLGETPALAGVVQLSD